MSEEFVWSDELVEKALRRAEEGFGDQYDFKWLSVTGDGEICAHTMKPVLTNYGGFAKQQIPCYLCVKDRSTPTGKYHSGSTFTLMRTGRRYTLGEVTTSLLRLV